MTCQHGDFDDCGRCGYCGDLIYGEPDSSFRSIHAILSVLIELAQLRATAEPDDAAIPMPGWRERAKAAGCRVEAQFEEAPL